jgi:hypothetical protein
MTRARWNGLRPPQRTKQSAQRATQSGLSLAELIIGLGLAAVVTLGIVKGMSHSRQSAELSGRVLDQTALRGNLLARVDCARTLAAGTPPCAVGSYIPLRDAQNREVMPAGGGTIGKFTVLARCTALGIEVRSAMLSPEGHRTPAALNFTGPRRPQWYLTDPSDPNLRLDWAHHRSALFAPGGNALCAHRFGTGAIAVTPPTTCPNNGILTGINFYQNTVSCATMSAPCPADQASSWNGTSFTCVESLRDTTIRDRIVNPSIRNVNTTLEGSQWECVTGFRRFESGSSSFTPIPGKVQAYDSGSNWGMTCLSPYVRFGCMISNAQWAGDNNTDWDIRPHSNGCHSDDEERNKTTNLSLVCCKPSNIAP